MVQGYHLPSCEITVPSLKMGSFHQAKGVRVQTLVGKKGSQEQGSCHPGPWVSLAKSKALSSPGQGSGWEHSDWWRRPCPERSQMRCDRKPRALKNLGPWRQLGLCRTECGSGCRQGVGGAAKPGNSSLSWSLHWVYCCLTGCGQDQARTDSQMQVEILKAQQEARSSWLLVVTKSSFQSCPSSRLQQSGVF